MFDSVMVGIDEWTDGRDAIVLARQLVSERGAIRFAHVTTPTVGQGLHELARADHADLLVVGSHPSAPPGRVWIHDATRQALGTAPCSLAIAPRGYAEHPNRLSEIGVAFNSSPESRAALAVARDLAAQYQARLSAFNAVASPPAIELAAYSASVDLLVIGPRGYGALGPPVYGSVTRELARCARSPLLILPPGLGRTAAETGPESTDAAVSGVAV